MRIHKTLKCSTTILLSLLILFGATITIYAQPFNCNANRHDYLRIEYMPATETTDGRAVYECRLCGNRTTLTLFATGHIWSEWAIVRQPTCTEPGLRSRTCHVGVTHSEYEEIPALGHQWVETIIEPTCTEYGQRVRTCSRCGESYTEAFGEPLGHSYVETIMVEPTCEHEGERIFTCEHCGDYYAESIPALEHIWSEWIIDIPAEAGVEGRGYRECLICGDRIWETIPALPIVPTERPLGVQEIIITGANVGLWIILFLALSGEVAVIIWKRKRKKEIRAQKRYTYSGKDGYEWL